MSDYIETLRKSIGHAPILQCGACTICVNKDNEILLIKRRDNGCWGLPGGSVELDEVVEEAAKRELFEETGLTAKTLELFGVYSGKDMHYVYPNGDEVSNVDHAYICRDFSGELKPEQSEVSEMRFFAPDEFPDNISPPQRKVLEDYIRRIDTAVCTKQDMVSGCLICERINMIKSSKNPYFVYELETGYVVIGDHQHFYGYSLFLYKEHTTELHYIKKDIRQKHLDEMSMVYEAVFNAFKPEKMNCELLGNGDAHVHWHLFPRNSGDTPQKGPVWLLPMEEMFDDSKKLNTRELEEAKDKLRHEIELLIHKY